MSYPVKHAAKVCNSYFPFQDQVVFFLHIASPCYIWKFIDSIPKVILVPVD